MYILYIYINIYMFYEFPAQIGENEKKVRTRSGSLDDRTLGCLILP